MLRSESAKTTINSMVALYKDIWECCRGYCCEYKIDYAHIDTIDVASAEYIIFRSSSMDITVTMPTAYFYKWLDKE